MGSFLHATALVSADRSAVTAVATQAPRLRRRSGAGAQKEKLIKPEVPVLVP